MRQRANYHPLVLTVHFLGRGNLTPLLGGYGAVARDIKLQDDGSDTSFGSHKELYVNDMIGDSRPPGSRRISPPRFEPSRLRIHHTVHPRVVAPAIHGSPSEAHSVVAMPHRTFSLAGTILIPD